MGKLVRVDNKDSLSLAEICALSDRDISLLPKLKGEIIMEFRDKDTGALKKRRHIYNTRTRILKNAIFTDYRLYSGQYEPGGLVIANDDGEWHNRKNVIRSTYEDNGANYFYEGYSNTTWTSFPSLNLYQYVSQFNAAPAGTTKTINAIGFVLANALTTQGNGRFVAPMVVATKLPGAGETQDEYTVLNITYKITFTT